ncbi:MAG: cytochrome B, partial [Thiomonas arsenitoxydans]|nr:cytochrome B [Thiomonas arsenitoxydans]
WGISLQTVAWAHTIGAYMMLIFFIIHVYLTTTGHTPLAHIMTMIRGYEDEPVHHHPRAKAAPTAAPTTTLTPGENV